MLKYILFGGIWCCWCGLHSYLISLRLTGWMETGLGPRYRFYRLAYNCFSVLSLSIPLAFSWSLSRSETAFFTWDGGLQLARYTLLLLASLLFFSGSRQYRLSYFLGTAQIGTGEKSLSHGNGGGLRTTGVLGVVRHPWYLGGIILVWSAFRTMYPSMLISASILTGYFVIGSLLEERKLLAQHGNVYREYQQRVSMLLPVKWVRNVISKHRK